MTPRQIYEKYAAAVAYVSVETKDGDHGIGTAFHVGNGVFVTARHVIEEKEILSVATTESRLVPDPNGLVSIHGQKGTFTRVPAGKGTFEVGPYFHPDDSIDVAAFKIAGIEPAIVQLGGHLDDWIEDSSFMLMRSIVMGYPPIPFSKEPLLVASSAEVNAVVDKRKERHPHFVVSALARGGFSGGPCITEHDFVLGLVTESLMSGSQASELGFMTVLTVEPIYNCLEHYGILPDCQKI